MHRNIRLIDILMTMTSRYLSLKATSSIAMRRMLSTTPSPPSSSSTTTSSSIGHNISKSNNNPTSNHISGRRELRSLSSLPELIEDELQVYHYEEHKQQHAMNNNKYNTFRDSERSPSHLSYVEGVNYPITSELQIVKPQDDAPSGIWPVFRIMVSFICFIFYY